MSAKFKTDQGWTEAIIKDNCDFDQFYKLADILATIFNVKFKEKLSDFDSVYWDFEYDNHHLTLHYNIYLGVTIFPKNMKGATKEDNETVMQISTLLFEELKRYKT